LHPTTIPDLSPDTDMEIEQAFGAKVVEMLQARGQAPTVAEMAELREMVSQDYTVPGAAGSAEPLGQNER